jgi:hypothetical protein
LIRTGKLCKGCTANKCNDAPTPSEPAIIGCPACDGLGCVHCEMLGSFEISDCPQSKVSDFVDFIQASDLFHQGCPPVMGGSLDQACWFLDAAQRLKTEMDVARGGLSE